MFQQANQAQLRITGERMVSELSESFFATEDIYDHLHRYAKALDFVEGKEVLDIASGEGYGSNLLSKTAKMVYGVDISTEAVEFAANKYQANNLGFLVGSADSIPLPDDSVDIVVSFETLEHHDKHDEMMVEIKRVLRPGGIMIMSTPDTDTYGTKGGNHFHVKELTLAEFKNLINKYFTHSKFFFQRYIQASIILSEDKIDKFKEFQGDFLEIQSHNGMRYPYYNICIASDSLVQVDYNSIFHNYKNNMYSADVLNRVVNEERQRVYDSRTYRLGNLITAPVRLIKNIFN